MKHELADEIYDALMALPLRKQPSERLAKHGEDEKPGAKKRFMDALSKLIDQRIEARVVGRSLK